jgi:ADP-ribose pyrophosphatase
MGPERDGDDGHVSTESIEAWDVTDQRELITTGIFKLTARASVSPRTGRIHDFYVLEAPDWINVIPLLDDDRVVMVRQYRHGRREPTLEIPGGMVDPSDADPLAAARRELLEETGYEAGNLTKIGDIAPNPAIQSNLCHSYVARQLTFLGTQDLDSTEEIEVVTVPLNEIPAMIRDGTITHSLVVVAFCFMLELGRSLETSHKSW